MIMKSIFYRPDDIDNAWKQHWCHRYLWIAAIASLILLELILCGVIIKKVPYTEIDWIAYMQEVEGYLSGKRNYLNIKGDTGPLVYPAGFLYVFSLLYWMTTKGANILTGQIIFAVLYVLNAAVVFLLYQKSGQVPLAAFVTLVLSKRLHSIFVLRMFNDCVAVFCGYIAIWLFTQRKFRFGCLIYSFGVGIKMNMLLQAPGILLMLLMATGIYETIICLSICAILQLILGWPFLTTYPVEYITKSFELSRVFKYKWTVNFKFLPKSVFIGKPLSIVLLLCTIIGMCAFAYKWILENTDLLVTKNKRESTKRGDKKANDGKIETTWKILGPQMISNHFIISTIFVSNFIGVAFARTLHYQFYCWYFHTLPLILWQTKIPTLIKLLILGAIEYSFNVYPATSFSSALLQACHLIILIGIFWSPAPRASISSLDEASLKKEG